MEHKRLKDSYVGAYYYAAINCQYDQNTPVNIYKYASSVASTNTETRSPALDIKITEEALQSISNSDEEIVGIITMEDVLEELLQVIVTSSSTRLKRLCKITLSYLNLWV